MPLPSQSRTQRWATGKPGANIPKPRPKKPASRAFLEKREMILTRDSYTCHVCNQAGNLIDFKVDKCICRRCLHPEP